MDVERSAVNRLFQPGRATPGLGRFLLSFEKVDTGATTICLVQNSGVAGGPLILEFEETGGTAAVPLAGEVQLSAGDWELTVYEQSSSTNLNPSLANVTRWSELVRVSNDAGASDPVPYDPCDYCDCGDPGEGCTDMDITVNVNGAFVETVSIDPCVTNTLNINIT